MSAAAVMQWGSLREYDPLIDKSYQQTRLGEPLVDYLASKLIAGRADGTLRDKEVYVGSFAIMWPQLELRDVEARHVMHWLSEMLKQLAPETVRVRRSHLNNFFDWCVAWDLLDKNPMRRIESPRRQGRKVYDIFSEAEVKALCDLPLIDGCLMQIMLDTGLRRSECSSLRVRHVRSEPNHGELVILQGKGSKDRTVPLTRRLASSIAMLRHEALLNENDYLWYVRVNQGRTIKRDRPIGDGSFSRWWTRVLEDAGVQRRNPHMARHTYATRWLRRGGRLETLSIAMGHASIATTKDLYGHLDSTDVARDLLAIETFEALDS